MKLPNTSSSTYLAILLQYELPHAKVPGNNTSTQFPILPEDSMMVVDSAEINRTTQIQHGLAAKDDQAPTKTSSLRQINSNGINLPRSPATSQVAARDGYDERRYTLRHRGGKRDATRMPEVTAALTTPRTVSKRSRNEGGTTDEADISGSTKKRMKSSMTGYSINVGYLPTSSPEPNS